MYKPEDIRLNIILVNIEGEYIMLHSVCCVSGTERALEFVV